MGAFSALPSPRADRKEEEEEEKPSRAGREGRLRFAAAPPGLQCRRKGSSGLSSTVSSPWRSRKPTVEAVADPFYGSFFSVAVA
jgi:hypothetical protein